MDFSKLSQVVAPNAVTEPGGSFPSQTDAAIVTTSCAVIDLARVFCSISVRKGKRNLLTFRRNRQQCAFKDLHQGYVHSPNPPSQYIVSVLRTNLRVAKFQICECMFHQCQAWVETAACPLSYCCWSFNSTISRLWLLLQWIPLACSADASPCMLQLLHFSTLQGAVL